MGKFKSYNTFINEKKYNWSERFNKESWDNNYVGQFGHSFNKIEEVPSMEAAEKILKDRGIKYDERIEGLNGMAHYRGKHPKWTQYQAGIEPETNEPYNSSMTVASYDPNSKKLYTEPTDMMKDYTKDPHIDEVVGTVNAPIYDEEPEEFPEIAIEKKDTKKANKINEIQALLKELYSTALKCEYDGHKIKETLYPKYKGTRIKMNITDEGKFMFDSFGRHPDVVINLDNMKKGKHNDKTILKEVKKHISKMTERIEGMPSMSQIASFEE